MNLKFILFSFVILCLYKNIDTQKLKSSDCKCRLPSNHRIVGGSEVQNNIPWMVVLKLWSNTYGEYKHFCAGTIINRKWILTAAHCANVMQKPDDIKKIQVRVGMIEQNQTEGVQIFGVKRFLIDNKYESKTNYGDIGFIEIDGNIQFTKTVQAGCFPENGKYESYADRIGSLHAVGFGVTNSYLINKRNGQRSKIHLANRLKEAFFNDISSESDSCHKYLVCIKQVKFLDSTCSGDSGGGLMYHKNGLTKIVGINSFGVSRDEGDYYRLCLGKSGFSRITTYINLFKEITGNDFCTVKI